MVTGSSNELITSSFAAYTAPPNPIVAYYDPRFTLPSNYALFSDSIIFFRLILNNKYILF